MNHTKIITRTGSYPVAIINLGGGTIKRAFDIILSGIGIVVSFPVWVISSIAIIMESGGPIFISQKRIGKDGNIFRMLSSGRWRRTPIMEFCLNTKKFIKTMLPG